VVSAKGGFFFCLFLNYHYYFSPSF